MSKSLNEQLKDAQQYKDEQARAKATAKDDALYEKLIDEECQKDFARFEAEARAKEQRYEPARRLVRQAFSECCPLCDENCGGTIGCKKIQKYVDDHGGLPSKDNPRPNWKQAFLRTFLGRGSYGS